MWGLTRSLYRLEVWFFQKHFQKVNQLLRESVICNKISHPPDTKVLHTAIWSNWYTHGRTHTITSWAAVTAENCILYNLWSWSGWGGGLEKNLTLLSSLTLSSHFSPTCSSVYFLSLLCSSLYLNTFPKIVVMIAVVMFARNTFLLCTIVTFVAKSVACSMLRFDMYT